MVQLTLRLVWGFVICFVCTVAGFYIPVIRFIWYLYGIPRMLKGACDRDSSFYVMYKEDAVVSITTHNDVKEI